MTLTKITIKMFCVIALLMMLTGVGVFLASHYQSVTERQQNQEAMIATIVANIENESQVLTQWTEAIAANSIIRDAFSGDESLRQEKQWELERQTSGLLKLRLLLPGVNQPDDSESPPLGYANLELVQNAQSENPVPIVVKMNLPDAHIAVARAVYDNESIVGTVLASFTTARLKNILLTLSKQDGTIALFQEQNSLSNVSDQSIMETEPNGVMPIKGTSWEIRYWNKDRFQFDEIIYGVGILLLSLVLLSVLCWRFLRVINSGLEQDIALLQAVLEGQDYTDPDTSDPKEPRFPVFDKLYKKLRILNLKDQSDGNRSIEVDVTTEEEEEKRLADRGKELVKDLDSQFSKVDALIDQIDNDDLDFSKKKPQAQTNYPGEMEVTQSSADDIPTNLPLNTGYLGFVDQDFTEQYLNKFGAALGSTLLESGMSRIVTGAGDSTTCSKAMKRLSSGLLSAGCKLMDLTQLISPVVAFSTRFPKAGVGVVSSDSCLSDGACRLKLLYNGSFVSAEFVDNIKQRCKSGETINGLGVSGAPDTNPGADYIGAIVEDIHIHCQMKVAVLAGSAAGMDSAGNLFKALGCEVVNVPLDTAIDGGRQFDPRIPQHLKQLTSSVQSEQADIGLAFDAEATCLTVVDSSGNIIWSDRVMMMFVADVLQRFPGADILFDKDCCSELSKTVSKYSGKLITSDTGESVFKQLSSNNMPLAGNMNGQFVFADRWLHFPDALYAGARLLEILSSEDSSSHELFSDIPDYVGTPPLVGEVDEQEAVALLQQWSDKIKQSNAIVIDFDKAMRVDVKQVGWATVYYDQYQSGLVFRFQSEDERGMQKLKKSFKKLVPESSTFKLPF